jgi:hypothetical protein
MPLEKNSESDARTLRLDARDAIGRYVCSHDIDCICEIVKASYRFGEELVKIRIAIPSRLEVAHL